MTRERRDHGLGMTTIAFTTAIGTLLTGAAAVGVKVVSDEPMDEIGSSGTEETAPIEHPAPGPGPSEPPETDPTDPPEPEPVAVITVSYRLRPELGEVSEEAELIVDGESVGGWHVDESSTDGAFEVTLVEGEHDYELLGTYDAYDAAGVANPWAVAGSGTLDVLDGEVYEVVWDPVGGFSLELV
jgi:hypothetical protein